MKKYLVIALAAVALTACTKESTPAPTFEETDLCIVTKASDTKALLPDYAANSNNFFPQDELGFFMAVTGTVDPATTVVPDTYKFWDVTTEPNAANYGYIYGTPYWTPLNPDAGKLKYQKDKGVQLFAYFPRQNSAAPLVANNPLKFPATLDATTNPVLEYQIPANQTDPAVLRMADLMWSKNTNEDKGFTLSSKPVTMTFSHLMARANIAVKAFNSQAKTGDADKVYTLRAVIINGNQINVEPATFNLVSGKLETADQNAAYNGQVYYFDNTVTPALNATVKETHVDKDNTVMFETATTPAIKNIDLLVHPFEQELTKNDIIFILSTNEVEYTADQTFATKYPTIEALQAAVLAGDKGLLRYSSPFQARVPNTATSPANNGQWLFDAGMNNILTVRIDVSSKAIDIITTITPWTNLPATEVPAE